MAIQRPYGINIQGKIIDGQETNKITWRTSGDTSTGFSISIYLNSDNTLIWNLPKINSYALEYSLPAGTLTNGNEYKIQITVYNLSNQSATSDSIIFATSSRPIITINTIPSITSPSYNFTAAYSQLESVPLQSWVVYLYNSDQVKISQSPINTETTLEYLFSNLQNEKTYYIEFQATSSKGLVGTSGLVEFSVQYMRPMVNVGLTAENVDNAGIRLSWSVTQIIGEGQNYAFIDNEKVDLRNGLVSFSEGLSVSQDFTIKIWLENPTVDTDLFVIKGSNGEIKLKYYGNRFHLFKSLNGLITHIGSSEVFGTSFFVVMQQIKADLNLISEVIA